MEAGYIYQAEDLDSQFTKISNSLLRNVDLTFGEKSVMMWFLSHSSGKFRIRKTDLHKHFKEGREAVNTAFKGLISKQLIVTAEIINEGRFDGYNYQIVPFKQTEPFTENPSTVKPYAVNPYSYKKTKYKKTKEKENKESFFSSTKEKKDFLNGNFFNNAKQGVVDVATSNNEESVFSFDKFWKKYPIKIGKLTAKKSYKNISEDNRKIIRDTIENFIGIKLFESYRHPLPTTYLNQERWNDDLSSYTKPTKFKIK